ncbi:Efflux RND transporter periplasmic adaptor subunit [Sulfidibacter corallicola]|uniref:Efflux RND transporter periplasmic adaptor subunit n=1 Tax=Sulfidibacter corallicola TaxID=2818388 RepID=A0A8A4TP19_SULCO|nr:efflux RND transporter periplasmic adaptor subunit [Sulfidibacter corallicola]QTD50641.1 efflux RND transporter periplasmic adaptor subunit [Sulfidibacter corallicola]
MKRLFERPRALFPILAAVTALLVGCAGEAPATPAAPPPPAVTVQKPHQKTITHYKHFTGMTEALESVTVRARVEGIVERKHFVPGSLVRKGDLLYSLDAEPFEARLDEAKATLAIRKAELDLAEATGRRRREAFKDKAVSEVAVIEADADIAIARAAVVSAEAALKRATLDLSYTRITAPIDGRIGRTLVDPGNLVGAGERTALTTIVGADPLYVYFTINERDLLEMERFNTEAGGEGQGTPVELGLAGGSDYPFEGSIHFVDTRVDPETGTLRIRAIFANPDHRLLPGLFARVRVPVGAPTAALLVPETAVNRDQQGDFLLVLGEDDLVRYRPVATGPLVDDLRVISGGIEAGDRVIVNGLQKARPGTPVTPTEKPSQMANAAENSQPPA